MPAGWLEALAALPAAELHAVPSGVAPQGAPADLATFVGQCRTLSLPRVCTPPPPRAACACAAAPALGRVLTEGVPAKKRHEVRRSSLTQASTLIAHSALSFHLYRAG